MIASRLLRLYSAAIRRPGETAAEARAGGGRAADDSTPGGGRGVDEGEGGVEPLGWPRGRQ